MASVIAFDREVYTEGARGTASQGALQARIAHDDDHIDLLKLQTAMTYLLIPNFNLYLGVLSLWAAIFDHMRFLWWINKLEKVVSSMIHMYYDSLWVWKLAYQNTEVEC